MDSRIREALERIANECDIGEHTEIARKALLTAEPEPCEDAIILAGRILAHAKPQSWPDQIDEYAEQINAYATQVANKRAEELRAQVDSFWNELHQEAEKQYDKRLELLGPIETEDDAAFRKTLRDGWSAWLLAKRIVINRLAATEPKS